MAQYADMYFVCGFCDGNARTIRVIPLSVSILEQAERHVYSSIQQSDIYSCIQITSIHWSFHMQDEEEGPIRLHMKQASLRMQFGIPCMRSSCVLFMYNLYKGYRQCSLPSVLLMASTQNCR
jgi:hypothetical protein